MEIQATDLDKPQGGSPSATPSAGNQPIRPDEVDQPPSVLGALFRGFLHGMGDVVRGGAQIGVRMAQAPQIGQTAAEMPGRVGDIDQAAQRSEQQYQASPSAVAHPIASGIGRVGGNIAATAPLAAAPGGAATLPARLAVGAVTGAASGAMQPVTGGGDFWTEKAKQLAAGGAVGGAIGGAGYAIPAALGATLPPPARSAISAYPIIGRMVAGAEARTPENFNIAAVNQALEPLGLAAPKNLKAGPGLLQFAKDKYDDAYNALLPKLSLARDPQLTQELGTLRQGATDMGDDDLRQFLRNLENRFGKDDRRLEVGVEGREIKEIEGKLRTLAVDAGKQNKTSLAEHLFEARDRFLDAVERQNPAEAPALKKINQGFALYARVETAAASAEKGGRHTFTPQELRNASWRSDKSARHGNFARAGDLMQGVANAGDFALSRSQWNPGAVTRIVMPVIGATLGLEHGGGAMGVAAGTAAGAGLPAVVNAARRAPVGPGARAVGSAISGAAPAAAGTAARMKASRKVGELKTQLHSANRRGDLKEMQSLNSQLAEAIADYRKLRPSA